MQQGILFINIKLFYSPILNMSAKKILRTIPKKHFDILGENYDFKTRISSNRSTNLMYKEFYFCMTHKGMHIKLVIP